MRTAAVAALLAGCVPRAPTSISAGVPSRSPSTVCPFGLRGVRVSVDDVDAGIDVAFVAFATDVVELRRRVHAAFDGQGEGAEPPAPGAEPPTTNARITFEDAGNGMMMHARTSVPGDVKPLRKEMRALVERAAKVKECQ